MSDPTNRDLARLGVAMGETDGELWKAALRALASAQTGSIGTEECHHHVAAQVYEAASDADTEQASEYVEAFRQVYGLEDLADVNDLLGRERFERQNYSGQLAFAGAE